MQLTFTGAITGKAKGGIVTCITSTEPDGRELSVSITNFKLPGFAAAALSFGFEGANLSAGAHDFGGSTATSTGIGVAFAPGGGKGYAAGEGNGTATLNTDKKSGKIDGDLVEGLAGSPTGGPGVHVVLQGLNRRC